MKCQHSMVHPDDQVELDAWRAADPSDRGAEPRVRLVVVEEHDCRCGSGAVNAADCCEPLRELVREAAKDKAAWIRDNPTAKVV